jgi:NIPSNAP
MITCIIRYDIEPFRQAEFATYARMWGQAIPACGADLIGYFGPHEGSLTTGYGLYTLESLAAYEDYRARLKASPAGQEAFNYARQQGFIRREDRMFLTQLSAPHAKRVRR